ncbi:MAG TPA: Lpg1974 family pore-forming outer membrane protein [Chlamydiales bacterium]|nr:Lpg1974 family pore-forming outer membrane protein [Chlamydiales bacterium]
MCFAFNAQALSKASSECREEMPLKSCCQDPCRLQGEPLCCYGPAYNASAAIYVNPKCWKCSISDITAFVDASFTYWYAGEEGLAIASNGVLSSGTEFFAKHTQTLFQSFDYKPGFKVGAGIVGYHDWMIHAEYTWFRGQNTTHSGAPLSAAVSTAGIATTTASSGTAVWVVNDWFLQGTPTQALAGSAVSSTWRLSMDLIDAVASRPYYQGCRFIVAPFGGLRAAFIRQSMTVNLTESTGLFSGAIPSQPIQSRNHSNSWAIGPRVGCDSRWLLPMGFRLEGDFAASLLYTRYTSVKHSEDIASTTFNPGPYTASYSGYSCLRPEIDLGLGFGWGKYLYNQDYHIDFSADYDFMFFWSQNMMRRLLDDTLTGTGPNSSDLYLHGLTLTGRFDF